MRGPTTLRSLRDWAPVPTADRGFELRRWILLEANRFAVAGALLSFVFVSLLAAGTVWTFEFQRLLTETQAVQSILDTFMSGIILLVSIVVSINSIALSYDVTPVGQQEERIQGTLSFRRELEEYAEPGENPTDPGTFLRVMTETIRDRAEALEEVAEGEDEEFASDLKEHAESVTGIAEQLEGELDRVGGADLGVLWLGLETDYGQLLNRSRQIAGRSPDEDERAEEALEELMEALETFATGREYFKTLYYNGEVSELSRSLIVIALPSILVTATTILAINARLLPDVWLLGLPPLQTFVAFTYSIALTPFIVLLSYTLRLATVAHRSASAGPFVLRS